MVKCKIYDCIQPSRKRAMCNKHYYRWYRHNDPHYKSREYHNKSRTPIYIVWCNMIARCEDTTKQEYYRYGGRGIKVCQLWRNSFIQFYKDMGDIPFEGATIDRINNNDGYSTTNCEWTTHKINCNNRYYDKELVS